MTSGDALLSCVEVEPEGAPNAAVIWLHGLGADGHDFEPIVPYLDLDPEIRARFVFPHAPERSVTINSGMIMRAWYDIRAVALEREIDEGGVLESTGQVVALIERERERGIEPHRLVLAGFSQGGAIALHTGLRYPQKLAGILALSTYLPLHDKLAKEASAANRHTPIFMAHGSYDPVVPMALAELSREQLIKLDYKVDWRTYPMEHGVLPDEIDDISRWLDKLLP
jgi:phospholipase/carboxylesterase